jgi:hypothetical protein
MHSLQSQSERERLRNEVQGESVPHRLLLLRHLQQEAEAGRRVSAQREQHARVPRRRALAARRRPIQPIQLILREQDQQLSTVGEHLRRLVIIQPLLVLNRIASASHVAFDEPTGTLARIQFNEPKLQLNGQLFGIRLSEHER